MSTGIGVMIRVLFGGDVSAKAIEDAWGKVIKHIEIYDEKVLEISFMDGSVLNISDGGQSCCEHRYMSTDDDLAPFVEARFTGASVQDGPREDNDEWGDEHETQFLLVDTNKGTFTIVNHNVHNGYYGGFYMIAEFRRMQ